MSSGGDQKKEGAAFAPAPWLSPWSKACSDRALRCTPQGRRGDRSTPSHSIPSVEEVPGDALDGVVQRQHVDALPVGHVPTGVHGHDVAQAHAQVLSHHLGAWKQGRFLLSRCCSHHRWVSVGFRCGLGFARKTSSCRFNKPCPSQTATVGIGVCKLGVLK